MQTLLHAGGWNSHTGYHPQHVPWTYTAAGALGIPAPPSARDVVRFMRGRPLDFDPGTASAYSNLGYNVIERISGQSYAECVLDRLGRGPGAVARRHAGTGASRRLVK